MKHTAYIKLFAGLGNQLFQYAYGTYTEKQGTDVRFLLSPTKTEDGKCYDLPFVFRTERDNIGIYRSRAVLSAVKAYAKYIQRDYRTGFYQEYTYAGALSPGTPSFLRQNEYSQTELFRTIKREKSVSVHIRGGDYLNESASSFSGICTPAYYKKAAGHIMEKEKDAFFIIFTNDTVYAERVLAHADGTIKPGTNAVFASGPDERPSCDPGRDLFLISQCRHNIVANSTYSWWGARLNTNQEKTVIVPAQWTNDGSIPADRIIPPEWTRV